MGKKLYVGNLAYGVTDSDLQQMFEPYGTVQSAQVIMDRDTGRSKGFGFVEMGSDQEAQAAIAALNGKEVDGRSLTVNEARPKTEGGGGGGGGRGGYGGGGGGAAAAATAAAAAAAAAAATAAGAAVGAATATNKIMASPAVLRPGTRLFGLNKASATSPIDAVSGTGPRRGVSLPCGGALFRGGGALGRRPVADAAPPFLPPLRLGSWFSFLPRPDPDFLPPCVSALTVAHARRSASPSLTPRLS